MEVTIVEGPCFDQQLLSKQASSASLSRRHCSIQGVCNGHNLMRWPMVSLSIDTPKSTCTSTFALQHSDSRASDMYSPQLRDLRWWLPHK